MILFSIARFEFTVLYVVRWTFLTEKLDVKISYIFKFFVIVNFVCLFVV
jgi:hypothetical protein